MSTKNTRISKERIALLADGLIKNTKNVSCYACMIWINIGNVVNGKERKVRNEYINITRVNFEITQRRQRMVAQTREKLRKRPY